MKDAERPEDLRRVFRSHGLTEPSPDLLHALIEHAGRMKSSAGRARRTKPHPRYSPPLPQPDPFGWETGDRIAALNHAYALLSYADKAPRNAETPRRRRQQLMRLLDRLPVAILLKATRTASGDLINYDVAPLLDGLRRGRPRRGHLEALTRAILALGAPQKTGRPPAPYSGLIRGAMIGWKEGGGGTITTSLSYPGEGAEPHAGGQFVPFLRQLFRTLGIAWPGDAPVYQQMLKLKNEETFLLGP